MGIPETSRGEGEGKWEGREEKPFLQVGDCDAESAEEVCGKTNSPLDTEQDMAIRQPS